MGEIGSPHMGKMGVGIFLAFFSLWGGNQILRCGKNGVRHVGEVGPFSRSIFFFLISLGGRIGGSVARGAIARRAAALRRAAGGEWRRVGGCAPPPPLSGRRAHRGPRLRGSCCRCLLTDWGGETPPWRGETPPWRGETPPWNGPLSQWLLAD